MKPSHYRAMLDRAIRDGNGEVLDSMCNVLAENESAKAMLIQKGYGPARAPIDTIVRQVPLRHAPKDA
jgi:hypothetical protein